MQIKRHLIRLIIFVSIVFAVFAGIVIFTSSKSSAHGSDKILEENFLTREDDFRLLLGMCQEDSVFVRIADDFN